MLKIDHPLFMRYVSLTFKLILPTNDGPSSTPIVVPITSHNHPPPSAKNCCLGIIVSPVLIDLLAMAHAQCPDDQRSPPPLF